MANDGWEDAPSADEWEEAPSAADLIPGAIPQTKPRKATDKEIALDSIFGVPEGVLGSAWNLVLSGVAVPPALIQAPFKSGNFEKEYNDIVQKHSYYPKTRLGERIVEKVVDPVVTQFLGPLGGMTFGGVSGRRRMPKAEPIAETPAPKNIRSVLDKVDQGWEDAPAQMELPLETSPQQIAEMQARQTGQRDLFAPVNEPMAQNVPQADMSPMNPVRPMDTTAQGALFDQPEQGRVANPYEAAAGDWRIDENGIPIKANLSMEAQQMQNPLQRNLWGDELEPTMSPVGMGLQGVDDMSTQMGRPLTEAIDAMPDLPWRSARDEGIDMLKGPVEASGALEGARMEANSPFNSQRGVINMDVFDPAFKVVKELANGLRLVMKGSAQGPAIWAVTPENKIVGQLSLAGDNWARKPISTDNLEASWVTTDPKKTSVSPDGDRLQPTTPSEYPGLATEMYKFAAEQGNDIVRSAAQTPEGKAMWDRFEAKGIATKGKIPWSQRGAIDLGNSTEPKPGNPISSATPDSPLVRAGAAALAAQNQRAAAAKIAGIGGYFDDIDTPEKVFAAINTFYEDGSPVYKDITGMQLARGKTVSPGINSLVINTDNPLLKYTRTKTRQVFQETDALARQYITDKKTGIASLLGKMTQVDKNRAIEALQEGDRRQKYVTRAQMEEAGYSPNSIEFVERIYEMDRVKLAEWNKARESVGMKPVEERPGHFPGIFRGDYKQLVMGKDNKIIGLIAVDSTYQLRKAQKKLLEQFPEAKFTSVDRKSLGGNGRRSDMFSGMNDVMELLGSQDPMMAQVKALVDESVKENADALFNANLHSLKKKGIVGNEGNKPWLDATENANSAIKAYLQYWEEGIISHKNLPVERELKALMSNPMLDGMTNAKDYVNSYVNNMTGRSLGTVGDALNKIIDAPFEALGLGPTVPREAVNQLNKRVSQHLMGWGNYLFSAIQFLQVPQMAIPEMMKVARGLGVPEAKITTALASLTRDIPQIVNEVYTGKSNLSPTMREAYHEAQRRGLMDFSEFQEVSRVTQSKGSRMYDKAVDWNRVMAEKSTRPGVFFMAVKLLEDSGLPMKDVFDVAYNATQRSMIDYSLQERPMMYQRLGVVGQLAGSLQTFKHGQLSQLAGFLKDAAKGKPAPLIAATLVMLSFAGIKGAPGYQEIDETVKLLSDKFFGNRRSISEIFLAGLPEWAKSGALSTATDINFQSRLSAANVLPDSLPEAVSPYLGPVGKVVEGATELATQRDPLAAKNLALALTPSGPAKGLMESAISTSPDNTPIDKRGELGNPRSEWDAKVRKFSGATTLAESLRNEKQYNQIMRHAAHKAAQTDLVNKAKRAYVQGRLTEEMQQKLMQKYVARNGDPQQFVNTLVEYAQTTPLNKQQRLQGIPSSSLSSIYRYQVFNE